MANFGRLAIKFLVQPVNQPTLSGVSL